jgi:hypothetical protein
VRALSLQIAALLVLVVFGVPIAFFPLRWARAFGWRIPNDVDLTRYFGRCLGVMILSLSGLAVWASLHPPLQPLVCFVAGATMVALSLVHVVGWLEKAQPFLETLEIFLYGGAGSYFLWLAVGVQ